MAREDLMPPWQKGKNGWVDGKKPENIGRPKNRLKAFLEDSEERVSFDDIRRMTEKLMTSDDAEIKAISDSKTLPFLVVTFAAALIADKKKGVTSTYQTLMDRILGKAIQPTVGVLDNDLHNLSPEDYEAKKAEFLQKNLDRVQKATGKILGEPPKTE